MKPKMVRSREPQKVLEVLADAGLSGAIGCLWRHP